MVVKSKMGQVVDNYAQDVVEGRSKPSPNLDAFIYYKVLKR